MDNRTPKSVSRRERPGELIEYEGFTNRDGFVLARGRIGPPELYPPQICFGWEEPLDQQEVLVYNGLSCIRSPALSEAGLFRMFAQLETTAEILEFAEQYGMLQDGLLRGHYRADNGEFEQGEPIALWHYCISQLRSAIRLLDGYRGEVDVTEHFLAPTYALQGQEIAYVTHPAYWREILDWSRLLPDYFGEEPDRERVWNGARNLPIGAYCRSLLTFTGTGTVEAYRRGNFRQLAGEALYGWLNQELIKPTAEYVGWEGREAGIRPMVRKAESGFVLRLGPTTLLDLMWLQLAQAFAGDREYRKCLKCPRWFAVVEFGKQRRSDRIYCSAACKTRAFRDKQVKEQGKRHEGTHPQARR